MEAIWIVEDDDNIALLIQRAMEKGGWSALRLCDAAELEHQLKKGTPTLLLLDLMLRGKNGFEILAEWTQRKETQRIPVIILSARGSEVDKVRGLELGAEDYMTKPFGVRELQARVRTALRRVTPQALRETLGELTLQPDSRQTWVNGRQVNLTYREFEVLYYLLKRPGQLVTRGQLMREVWGYDTEEDPSRTVDYHVKMVRQKLGDDPAQPRFIQTIRGGGYRLIPPDEA